jgi:hypothetical protein
MSAFEEFFNTIGRERLSTRTSQSIFSIADIGVLTDYVGFYSGIAVTLTVALVSHRRRCR